MAEFTRRLKRDCEKAYSAYIFCIYERRMVDLKRQIRALHKVLAVLSRTVSATLHESVWQHELLCCHRPLVHESIRPGHGSTGAAVTNTVQTPAPATKASALPVAEDALGKVRELQEKIEQIEKWAASTNKLEERISQGEILVANSNMQNQLGEHTATILSGVAGVIEKNPVIEKDLADIKRRQPPRKRERIQNEFRLLRQCPKITSVPKSASGTVADEFDTPSPVTDKYKTTDFITDKFDAINIESANAFENTPTKVILRSGLTPINGPAKKENGPAANATNNKTKSVFDVDEDDVAAAALGNIFYVKDDDDSGLNQQQTKPVLLK
ncbi:hypothetical protein MY3296_008038 [Beauveria thailandica]